MKVVIFCGGLGTRLRGADGRNLPKPLVRIGYRPMIWHVMKYYAHFGHTDFILCLGEAADLIKEYFLSYSEWVTNNFTLTNGGRTVELETSDIGDWRITFVDTGLRSNVGERLRAIQPYVKDEEMFLANYTDGLTDLDLTRQIETFRASGNLACFLAVTPSQSFHVVRYGDDNLVTEICPVGESGVVINGGYFVFRQEIFEYIREGEELVVEPFARLIRERQLLAYPYENFWCIDTFKDHVKVTEMYEQGRPPWAVWDNGRAKHRVGPLPARLSSDGRHGPHSISAMALPETIAARGNAGD